MLSMWWLNRPARGTVIHIADVAICKIGVCLIAGVTLLITYCRWKRIDATGRAVGRASMYPSSVSKMGRRLKCREVHYQILSSEGPLNLPRLCSIVPSATGQVVQRDNLGECNARKWLLLGVYSDERSSNTGRPFSLVPFRPWG